MRLEQKSLHNFYHTIAATRLLGVNIIDALVEELHFFAQLHKTISEMVLDRCVHRQFGRKNRHSNISRIAATEFQALGLAPYNNRKKAHLVCNLPTCIICRPYAARITILAQLLPYYRRYAAPLDEHYRCIGKSYISSLNFTKLSPKWCSIGA